MGRLGIGYKDVERAINEILAKDLNPTVDRIRELLGTGSKTTIVNHLKSWRTNKIVGGGSIPKFLSLIRSRNLFLKTATTACRAQ